jgi:hypothetical protein
MRSFFSFVAIVASVISGTLSIFALRFTRNLQWQIALVVALLFALVVTAGATAEYDYKPGELLVVKGGKSPDKKFSIVSGDADKKGGFGGVYLMDAQSKQVLGKLEEVATGLDSAPEAYHAHWSPDSKHVGITSRADRHWADNVIYRIENQRAYLVETPELLCHAVPEFCSLTKELGLIEEVGNFGACDNPPCKVHQRSFYSEIVKWISPTRFVVKEVSQFQVRDRDPSASLGQYGEKLDQYGEKLESDVYYVRFKAEGECELLLGDKTRVAATRPVKDQKTSE